jgi:hypothetical protein
MSKSCSVLIHTEHYSMTHWHRDIKYPIAASVIVQTANENLGSARNIVFTNTCVF